MWIRQPPQLSRAFGRSAAGALCEPFTVSRFPAGARCTVVTVAGDLDLATVGLFGESAGDALAAGAAVVVDLSAVAFCSGAGLRALHLLQHRADETGTRVAWVVRTPAMRRLLRGTGAAGFTCYRDRADALAAFA